MTTVIDTSLWIDFTRARSPQSLKQFIAPHLLHPEAHVTEPVTFEVLRHATPEESKQLRQQFETFPLLETPADLWARAAELGQACRKKGFNVSSLDLLIARVALHHEATLVTFDHDFAAVATVSQLRLKLLQRPS